MDIFEIIGLLGMICAACLFAIVCILLVMVAVGIVEVGQYLYGSFQRYLYRKYRDNPNAPRRRGRYHAGPDRRHDPVVLGTQSERDSGLSELVEFLS